MNHVALATARLASPDEDEVSAVEADAGSAPTLGTEQASVRQDRADDFARLLSEALEDALTALGHRFPEYFLHLRAAQRRDAARRAGARLGMPAGTSGAAHTRWRNETIVQDLSSHLAFEIVHAASKYAVFLSTLDGRDGPTACSSRQARPRPSQSGFDQPESIETALSQ